MLGGYIKRHKTLWLVIILLLSLAVFFSFHMRILRIQGSSMEPTLRSGEYVVATNLVHVHDGQIAIFNFVSQPTNEFFVKRLIASGGQTIIIKHAKVYVDGTEKTFGPPVKWTQNTSWSLDGHRLLVPKGYDFVMGDNRNISVDSRNINMGLARERFAVLAVIP